MCCILQWGAIMVEQGNSFRVWAPGYILLGAGKTNHFCFMIKTWKWVTITIHTFYNLQEALVKNSMGFPTSIGLQQQVGNVSQSPLFLRSHRILGIA